MLSKACYKKDFLNLAIKEDQKQKIRELDFGNSTPQETIAHCDVNAIKGNGCYKCGSNDHCIKDCPLNGDIGNTYNSSSNSQQKQYNAYIKDQRKAGHESSLKQSLQTMTDIWKSLIKQTNQSQSSYQLQSICSKAPHEHFNTNTMVIDSQIDMAFTGLTIGATITGIIIETIQGSMR